MIDDIYVAVNKFDLCKLSLKILSRVSRNLKHNIT